MIRSILPLIILISILTIPESSANGAHDPLRQSFDHKDTIREDQILYNGKIWRNQYLNVENDQFLFSKEFLPGSISILGKTYTGIRIKFDIYNDEIITPADVPGIVKVNKELVDSFSLSFQDKTYKFINLTADSLSGLKGYANLLYRGRSGLYVRYFKELYQMSGQNMNIDKMFYQRSQVYFVTDKTAYHIKSKRDLYRVMESKKKQIKEFIAKNRIRVSKYDPESFIPVIKYFDSLIP